MKLVLATDEFKEELEHMIQSAMTILTLGSWYKECLITEDPDSKEIASDLSREIFKNLQNFQNGCEIIPLKDGRRALKLDPEFQDAFDKLLSHLLMAKNMASLDAPNAFLKAIKEALEQR